jgi:hypothetical protein
VKLGKLDNNKGRHKTSRPVLGKVNRLISKLVGNRLGPRPE